MREASTLDHKISNPAYSFAGGSRPHCNQIIINGVALGLDDILNNELFSLTKVKSYHETFRKNTPFSHIVFEGLFAPELLELVSSDFDRLGWSDWRHYDNANERKRASLPNTRFGHAAQLYFNTVHSGLFINFLERVSGIIGLVADPELYAGGLHEMPPGGRFRTHLDFNQHPITKLDNRLVFITYLNKDWRPSYGGALELWSVEENKCASVIEPTFGRSILFYQSSKAMHGHPDPVSAPGGRMRRSAAAYFYSNGRLDLEGDGYHSTIYGKPLAETRREKLANAVKYLTPPVIVDAVRKLKQALA